MNYYNEFDPGAAAWLRDLIRTGEIPDGDVDDRSILEVKPNDLNGYTQCHFFAGVGGWSYALDLAGVSPDEPLWTGSCPCQPFSQSGKQMGNADPRHLFPAWRRLIARCGPPKVYGEQVGGSLGREWLARVRLEMATLGYATRASDLCSAGVGSPNIRQRLYWMADAASERRIGLDALLRQEDRRWDGAETVSETTGRGAVGLVADTDGSRREREGGAAIQGGEQWAKIGAGGSGDAFRLADSDGRLPGDRGIQRGGRYVQQSQDENSGRVGGAHDPRSQGRHERRDRTSEQSPWSSSVVLPCTDGRARRIEPGSFPLVAGLPGRVGLLRGYGNAINPWVAKVFIQACEAGEDRPDHGSGVGGLAPLEIEWAD